MLDCKGMKKSSLLQMPPVGAYLHPKTSMSLGVPALHSSIDIFQSDLTEKSYKAAKMMVDALDASSLLIAYQVELEEDMNS